MGKENKLPEGATGYDVLLLQGPVGPFFKSLHKQLNANGFSVKRICFHDADRLFARKEDTYNFSGTEDDWSVWLREEFVKNSPSVIVMFGSSRPAHAVARMLAEEYGVPVVSLEEGYLRTGYITCEVGGNNQFSPLKKWRSVSRRVKSRKPVDAKWAYSAMCLFGMIYYLYRDFTKKSIEVELYHRVTYGVVAESIAWPAVFIRKFRGKIRDKSTIVKILNGDIGEYLLIPMQTPTDSQLVKASRGWSNEMLVEEAIRALSSDLTDLKLVFKTHPLDRDACKLAEFIRQVSLRQGVAERVIVIESGKIGELTSKSSGMIVINSTSAFSALHHRVPVLVFGDAIYRHDAVVTLGGDGEDIDTFMKGRASRSARDIDTFISTVKSFSLLPGDFYSPMVMRCTAENVVKRISSVIKTYPYYTKECGDRIDV
ncbi:hypothetical protein [Polycladidibacter stylochi]|uniref:capsular polysaccharide export protein, LipB/KpsS family n=1 Tax=Polycladidibacter stylochi TaxID=1807766 RepID=UPI00082AD2FF|nr:hypothetical protein [Pseudovibrio stylochi]